MTKCGWKLPSRGLSEVTKIQLINGCNYVQLMLVIESYNGPPKRRVKTNCYFRVVKKPFAVTRRLLIDAVVLPAI